MIITKQQLIQEGVLDFVKNNYGKGLLGAGAVLGAKAGIFGTGAQNAANNGIAGTSKWLHSANDKIAAEYGDTATKTLAKAKLKVDEIKDKMPDIKQPVPVPEVQKPDDVNDMTGLNSTDIDTSKYNMENFGA